MKHIRLLLATALLLVGFGGMLPAMAVAATPQQTVCSTLQSDSACKTTPPDSLDINKVIRSAINIFSFVIGVTAVVMVMLGGFRYITSGGDSGKITSAKNTITYAVIGLVIVGFSQTIVVFVIQRL